MPESRLQPEIKIHVLDVATVHILCVFGERNILSGSTVCLGYPRLYKTPNMKYFHLKRIIQMK